MKKQSLIHLHGLLAQVHNFYEDALGVEFEVDDYVQYGVQPTSIHKSKEDHKTAVRLLSEQLTSEMSKFNDILGPVKAVLEDDMEAREFVHEPMTSGVEAIIELGEESERRYGLNEEMARYLDEEGYGELSEYRNSGDLWFRLHPLDSNIDLTEVESEASDKSRLLEPV
jgi:hypothetical protein